MEMDKLLYVWLSSKGAEDKIKKRRNSRVVILWHKMCATSSIAD